MRCYRYRTFVYSKSTVLTGFFCIPFDISGIWRTDVNDWSELLLFFIYVAKRSIWNWVTVPFCILVSYPNRLTPFVNLQDVVVLLAPMQPSRHIFRFFDKFFYFFLQHESFPYLQKNRHYSLFHFFYGKIGKLPNLATQESEGKKNKPVEKFFIKILQKSENHQTRLHRCQKVINTTKNFFQKLL